MSSHASETVHSCPELTQRRDLENKAAALEQKSQTSVVPDFPDGGTKAWMVVFGCWCTSFASFGIVNSFGYAQNLRFTLQ